jgi:hypothetical protein
MLVRDLLAKLQQLPQDAEFVVWDDKREVYVGIDNPQALSLAKNKHDELVDAGYACRKDVATYVTVGLQG